MIRDAYLLIIAQIVFASTQWLFLFVLVRYGPQDLGGQYSYLLGLLAPIFLFFDFNFRVVRSTDRQRELPIQDFLLLKVVLLAAAFACCLIVFAFTDSALTLGIFIPVLVLKATESMYGLFYGQYQLESNIRNICYSLGFRSLAYSVGAGFVLFGVVSSGFSSVWIVSMGLVFSLLIVDALLLGAGSVQGETARIGWLSSVLARFSEFVPNSRYILSRGFPLALDALVSSLYLNVGRYMLAKTGDFSLVGYYSLILQAVLSFQLVVGAFGHASVGAMANAFKQQDSAAFLRYFRSLMRQSLGFSVVFIIAAIIGANVFIDRILGVSVAEYLYPYLMLVFFSAVLGIQRSIARVFQSLGNYRTYLISDLLLFLLLVSLLFLVPHYSVFTISLASCLSILLGTAATIVLARHELKKFVRQCARQASS